MGYIVLSKDARKIMKAKLKQARTLTIFVEYGINKQQSPFGAKICSGIFIRGHYMFREANSFPRAKTVSYEEKIMSKDKYPSIFSPQMATIVFIILQIFFATRAVLKIGEYLTIILRARVGYEMIDSQRGA